MGVNDDAKRPPDIAVVVLMRFDPGCLLWAWWRFLIGRFALYRSPGLRFAKVLGSGFEGGFGLRPSLSRHGLFCVFAGVEAAERFLESDWIRALDRPGVQWGWLRLTAYASRGSWSGHRVEAVGVPLEGEAVVSLTRASIRVKRALQFWRMAPPAEAALAAAPGCRLAVGLGEAPVLRQATLSVWDSVAAMDAYARSGAHLEAIRTAYRSEHFSESMFVRWRLMAQGGRLMDRQHAV